MFEAEAQQNTLNGLSRWSPFPLTAPVSSFGERPDASDHEPLVMYLRQGWRHAAALTPVVGLVLCPTLSPEPASAAVSVFLCWRWRGNHDADDGLAGGWSEAGLSAKHRCPIAYPIMLAARP